MSYEHLVKAVFAWDVDRARLKGRPRHMWLDVIEIIVKEAKTRRTIDVLV